MSDLTANPQNTITLATRERQKLVNLLFECSTMSRKEARDQIVADLPKAIQSSIRRDHQSTKLDIRLILDTCLNYGGGLEELIATVRHYEESSLQMQAVDEFVQELFTYDAKVRKKEQHEKLELTISTINLDEIDLERLYAASVPDDPLSTAKWYYPRGSSKGEILSQMLSRLVDAPIPEGDVPPILKFVERLALCAYEVRGELRNWIDTAAQDWGVNTQAISVLRKKLEMELEEEGPPPSVASESPLPYLLIMLEPGNGSNLNSFSVKAWLFYGQGEIDCLYSSDDGELYTSNTISEVLDKLLKAVASHNKLEAEMKARLVIEFFLPRELFCQHVESWEGDEVSLGVRNVVVLRSSERIKDITNKPFWETKWNKIRNSPPLVDAKPIHWIDHSEECDGRKVYANLINNNIVCLCLTLVPPLITDPRDKNEMFRMMFKTGTPIALWPRCLPDNPKQVQKIRRIFRAFMSRHRLSELPELLLEQRREASQGVDAYHLGHCLALLWDDPERLPPEDVKLEETEIRR